MLDNFLANLLFVGGAERVNWSMISRLFLLLTSVEGIFVIRSILMFPSEAGSARFFGLSATRLMMLGAASAVAAAALGLLLASLWKHSWFDQVCFRLKKRVAHDQFSLVILVIGIVGVLAGTQLALYAGDAGEPVVQAVLLRLQPFFVWISLICLQILVVLFSWDDRLQSLFKNNKGDSIRWFIIFLSFLFVLILIAGSGYGFSEETDKTGYFRTLGTPITGVQVFGAVLITILFVLVWRFIRLQSSSGRWPQWFESDFLVGLIIWILAFAIWMSVPLKPNWFADPPRAPNYTFSPNSDAHQYDAVAHSLIAGSGFWHQEKDARIRRPALSSVLALFHTIGGAGYEEIIGWQVALLALFPVVVYALTKDIHNRASAMLASLLIIGRERNSIVLADTITVSHAKVLMADLLATLGVVLFFLLILKGVKRAGVHSVYELLAGGVLGFFVMVRSELLVFIFAAGVFIFWYQRKKPRHWIRSISSMLIGFTFIVAPWIWRNGAVTGQFYLDKPIDRLPILRELDEILGATDQPTVNSAAQAGYKSSASMAVDYQDVQDVLITGMAANSAQKVRFIDNFLNHFSNGLIQSVIFLPMSPRLLISMANIPAYHDAGELLSTCCAVNQYVRGLPYWWSYWDGGLITQSVVPLLIAVGLLSIGLAVLWKSQKEAILFFFGSTLMYILFFALNSRSGGRWLLEIDWITLIVYSAGIIEIVLFVARWLGWELSPFWSLADGGQEVNKISGKASRHYIGLTFVLFFVGASMPIAETIIPARYTQDGLQRKFQALTLPQPAEQLQTAENLTSLVQAGDYKAWYGQALYPRYYEAGDGMDGKLDAYKLPYSRIELHLVGMEHSWVTLPYSGDIPEFPHASDVVVFGCAGKPYLESIAIAIYPQGSDQPQSILFADQFPGQHQNCPLPTD